jgi:hypothetical protein
MKTTVKIAIVTLAIAIPAFLLGQGGPLGGWWDSVWPWTSDEHLDPPSRLFPFFLVLAVVESLAMGLAVAFVVWGWPAMKRLAGGKTGMATAMYVSATWLLGNWWVHDNLHQITGYNFTGLVVIEYLFHVTLIAAGCVLCLGLATSALAQGRASAA